MTEIADREKLGLLPMWQYSKSKTGVEYDPDLRNVMFALRTSVSPEGKFDVERGTYGVLKGGALWISRNEVDFPNWWSFGMPATQESLGVNASTGLPLGGTPRNLFPVSAYKDARNVPAAFRSASNNTWGDIERRLSRLNAKVPFAVPFPNGWPFVVHSALNLDEQAEVALPGFVGLVAPSFLRNDFGPSAAPTRAGASGQDLGAGIFGLPGAGAPNPLAGAVGGSAGVFGLPGGGGGQSTAPEVEALATRVYDPDLSGGLRGDDFALLHSLFKLYRFPDSKCFDFRGKKELAPLGIALRLGTTKEGMAGHGLIYDGPEGAGDFGVLSWRGGGPLRTVPSGYEYGNADSQSGEGLFGPAAISAHALFDFHTPAPTPAGATRFAAPINFRNQPIPFAFQAPLFTKAFIGINLQENHTDVCGRTQEGKWDVVGTSFFAEVPEDEPPPGGGAPSLAGEVEGIGANLGILRRPTGAAALNKFLPIPTPGRPLVASVNEIGVPGLVFRAQAWYQGAPDLRNMPGEDFQRNPQAQRLWRQAAAVMRMEVIAKQNGDAQVATAESRRGSRYQGGPTASGSAWFMPPEQGLETLTQNVPTQSTTYLGVCGVRHASGTPDLSSGAYTSGFDWGVNSEADLTFTYRDDGGSATEALTTITKRGTVQAQAGFELQGYNDTGGAIADGAVVTVPSGGGITGLIPNIGVVSSATDVPVGIAIGSIDDGSAGTILSRGPLDGVTVAGSPTIGGPVYSDGSGGVTATQPYPGAPSIGVYWGA